MKTNLNQRRTAMTLIEMIVVIAVLAVLASMLLPATSQPNRHHFAQRISCLNNLKEIGTAYRLWAGDNGDVVPAQQTVASNGWSDFLTNANQGERCWWNYTIMQNELGQSPKLVVCTVPSG